MKFNLILSVSIVIVLIFGYGIYLYSTQEELLFNPKYLPKDYIFDVASDYKEINLKTRDNVTLNSYMVTREGSKGLVFFLHGNSGSIADWTSDYKLYQDLGYDYLTTDFRGFGKSTGTITNQQQILDDALFVFDDIAKYYKGKKIVIIGYSFGTTIASYIASKRKISKLVLLAPFYSLKELKNRIYPLFPNFMLKYDFETYKYIDNVEERILIFHGIDDRLIGIESSLKLKKHLKKNDEYIEIKNQGHEGLTANSVYRNRLIYEFN